MIRLAWCTIHFFLLLSVSLSCLPLASVIAEEAASLKFDELVDEVWEFDLRESPLFATSVGDNRFNDQLARVSPEDSQRRYKAKQEFFQRLEQIPYEDLSSKNKINYDILHRQLEDELQEFRFHSHLKPISQRSGFHISFPELGRNVPLQTPNHYEDYLSRLQAFGEYTEGHIALMQQGIATGQVLPEVVLLGWETAVDAQIVEDPQQSLLYEPFQEFPQSVPESEHQRLRAEARKAISEVVVPSYRRLREFLANQYVPQARDTIGASALPQGRDFYRHRVEKYTTLDMTPNEVHQLGLQEVERIRQEMEAIIRRVEFEGDFTGFLKFLREDPQFYVDSSEELMKEVALGLKKMDGRLPKLFGKLPRMPYGIREVPDYVAPRTTAAYYQRPSGDGTRAGYYFVNTYDLKSRPLYNIEALSLHEAVPGHHLQLALQQEIEAMPAFRRYSGFTAFVEGWALYAERLGLEAGFYQDPYSDFGRLTMEMWRACRLVVDTGIHYFGWTRQQAIEFMEENTALAQHDIRAEVDRYISWPGQALAYKIGELKIRELRQMAEDQLGQRFDIREFHDVILAEGALPLDVLESQVKDWLADQKETEASE